MASRPNPWSGSPTGSTSDKPGGGGMIVTTTPSIEGRSIRGYHGIVTGEVIVGANIFRDLFASITDIVGGRSGKYEDVLARARGEAIAEMKDQALALGANAVVGVDIDYEVLGQNGSMLMVSVSGTAVTV
jgi:uncharacterized protein YbjQ (UPF0145 family)